MDFVPYLQSSQNLIFYTSRGWVDLLRHASIDNLDYYVSVWSSSFATVVQMVVGIHVLYTIND